MKHYCHNCRFHSAAMYGASSCKHDKRFNPETGSFEYYNTSCSKKNPDDDCEHYAPGLLKRISNFFRDIRITYYKYRYPELFV